MSWLIKPAEEALDSPHGAVLGLIMLFLGSYWIRSAVFTIILKTIPPREVLPSMPKPAGHDFRETIKQGMLKYKDKAWIAPFQEPTVILPHSSLDAHVKKIPEPDLTLNENMYRRFFGAYTQVGTDDAQLVDALKFDLTRSVHGLLGEMAEEITYGYNTVVGHPETWKPYSTYQIMLQIVALASGRVFVGLPQSRDPAWVEASIQHTVGSVHFSDQLRSYPPMLRWIVAHFLDTRKQVQKVQDTVARLLQPIITRHLSTPDHANGKLGLPTDDDGIGRMTRWLLGHYAKGAGVPEPSRLVRDHLTLSFAAVHVASMALTHVLHDLAARPEYIDILRSEVDAGMDDCKGGVLDSKTLASLNKLDSFIKESLRLHPSGTIAWFRLTTVPLHLQNGQIIPKDTMVAYCNPRFNPNLTDFENADEFDGLRYVKLAQANGPQTRYKLDSLSADSLGFGYGLHACPGRSFAAAELKLIVAHLIRHYDICLRDGEDRPADIHMDFQIMPNPEARVLLRTRTAL